MSAALDAEETRRLVRGSYSCCRTCGRRFQQPGKGRPRVDCTDCRPPGSNRVVRVLDGFRSQARARHAARAAAARRVARDHPTEFLHAFIEECTKRGVAA